MRGRPAISRKVRVATGNRRRSPIKRSVRLKSWDKIDIPNFLSPVAAKIFPRFVKELKGMRTLTSSLWFAIKQACEAYADVHACRQAMDKYGRFESYCDKDGNLLHRKSAACLALESAEPRLSNALEKLGLTATSRNKVQPVDEEENEPGSEFF